MTEWMHITFAAKPNCYNMTAWAYGNCYGCGCCSKNKRERYESRLKYFREELEERENFKYWDDDPAMRAVQEKNVKADIKLFKRRIRYYAKRLQEVSGDEQG